MVQVASHSTFFSSSLSIANSSAEGRRGFLEAVMVGPQHNDDAAKMGGFGGEHNANSTRSRKAPQGLPLNGAAGRRGARGRTAASGPRRQRTRGPILRFCVTLAIHLEGGDERLLGDLHLAELPHPLLA